MDDDLTKNFPKLGEIANQNAAAVLSNRGILGTNTAASVSPQYIDTSALGYGPLQQNSQIPITPQPPDTSGRVIGQTRGIPQDTANNVRQSAADMGAKLGVDPNTLLRQWGFSNGFSRVEPIDNGAPRSAIPAITPAPAPTQQARDMVAGLPAYPTPGDGTRQNTAPVSPSVHSIPQSFADTYGEAAMRAGTKLGVDPNIILGQWGLETGWGKSVVPGTNNLGNIKDMTGGGVAATDNATGSKDKYRAFNTPNDFADHYADLIGRKYQGAVGTGSDAGKFAAALTAGGYAEDPNYAAKIQNAAGMINAPRGGNSGVARPPAEPTSEYERVNGPGYPGFFQTIKGMDSYYTPANGTDLHLYPTANGQLSEMTRGERAALAEPQMKAQNALDVANIHAGAERSTAETGAKSREKIEESRAADVKRNGTPIYNDVLNDPTQPALGTHKVFAGMVTMGDNGEPKFMSAETGPARVEPKIGDGYNAPDGTYGNAVVHDKKIVNIIKQ